MPRKDPQSAASRAAAAAASKRWRERHPEKVKAAKRREGERNRGKPVSPTALERQRAYRAAHPEIYRVQWQRRQARKLALPYDLTPAQWLAILEAYGNRCAYCGVESDKLTQDHVIPLSKGGGTTADNIVPACRFCNSRKSAGPPLREPKPRTRVEMPPPKPYVPQGLVCKRGHPLVEGNLYYISTGRTCRTCAIQRAHDRYHGMKGNGHGNKPGHGAGTEL